MAGHYPGILMTGHVGTNTPKLYPLAGDDRPLTLLKRGCANSVVGLELAEISALHCILFKPKMFWLR